jgi:NAD(P)-dependent dehydrogenase (short-subunit alcohol dehydrogenase family)
MSKAALNMMTVTMAKEFQMNGDNISVVALDPGYVATRMTNFRFRDDMDECITGIVNVLEKVSMNQTGTFLDWHGETLPW